MAVKGGRMSDPEEFFSQIIIVGATHGKIRTNIYGSTSFVPLIQQHRIRMGLEYEI